MMLQFNSGSLTGKSEVMADDSGFLVNVRGYTLEFKRVADSEYNVYQGDERTAYFRRTDKHFEVKTSAGNPIMCASNPKFKDIADEECCRFVAEMIRLLEDK